MLVKSQNKSRNDQKSTEKFEVVKHRKYCKPRSIDNEPIKCQDRYETLYTDGNDEETENSSDSYTRSPEETPDSTPKQVQSRISKKKRLKNNSTITVDQEINGHCVKSVQIRSFFLVRISCIQSEYRKNGSEKTPYFDTFYAVSISNQ